MPLSLITKLIFEAKAFCRIKRKEKKKISIAKDIIYLNY